MNQGHTRPRETRRPKHEVLPDGRMRITRFYTVAKGAKLIDGLFLSWGTADEAPATGATAGYATCRLTNQFVEDGDTDNTLVRVYEELSASAEQLVGNPAKIKLEDGRDAWEFTYIQFSSAGYSAQTVGSSTATGNSSLYLRREECQDNGTIRTIKRTYEGTGTVQQTDTTRNKGALLIRTIVSIKTTPSTPSGYTLISAVQNPVGGFPIYTYTFSKGQGLISVMIGTRTDNLREVTHVALGTKSTPTGIVLRDDYRDDDGHTVYTVTTMQTGAGGSNPASGSTSYEDYVPYTYPGRAKAFTETYDGKTMLNLFESPPVSTQVLATITISYQTSNSLGTISDYWNPREWATVKSQWTGAYGIPSSQVRELPGYRAVSSTPVTLAGSGYDATIYGHNIYAGTTARITVTGGPANPDGNTYTLHAELKPAFTALDGTIYYRKILVTATIPAQDALPV